MYIPDKLKKFVLKPNFMTGSRIIAIPAIVILLMFENPVTLFFGAIIFSIASVTDYFDGYLARTQGLVTTLGKVLDPVADKLLVASTLIMLVDLGFIRAWIAIVIVGRELAVTGLRCILIEKGQDVGASELGKYKTGFQIAALIPLILHYKYFGLNMDAIGQFFLYGALILTVWSGADYFIKARKFICM
jgi:CDP-diacylglycerol---glycerol-3-phosphate 3-phosphatidyltransferase